MKTYTARECILLAATEAGLLDKVAGCLRKIFGTLGRNELAQSDVNILIENLKADFVKITVQQLEARS
jgi:hypothetical protein